jgi:predicted Zn-dependent protease
VEATEAEISSLAKRAMDKAQEGDRPISLDPGNYTVILEPKALAELLEWTSYIAFGAKSYQDGTSFMAGKIGKKIAGENITIYDNGLEPNGLPVAFDYEGMPKTRRDIIREGRAVGVVYDSLYAARDNTSSTGNATLPDSDDGPVPLNVFVEAGDMPVEELIASTPRGILVTRFHYVNGLLEPEVALMTGMTRDGTFLVEDGVLKNRVEEMRFTDSVLRMLNHVTGISRERESIKSWWSDEGVYTVPYVRIDDVSFTGKTG